LFTQDLPALGVEVEFVESDDPRDWNALRRDTTRLAYVEAISNPLLHVTDLEGIAEWARGAGLVSMIDATMTTPIGLQPTRMGFDLVVHSATKFLNGHSDIVAGAVLGSRELCRGVLHKAQHLGGSLDPDACAQLMRGMKTLALRWERQCATALDLARWLHEHPRVERVLYPGLASHPSHRRAEQWLNGFGALFAFDVGDAATARSLQDGLEYFTAAPSFGGVESLITRPAHTSHALLGTVARAERGIGDGLLRVAVGVEDVEDLRGDLQRALETL